MRRRERRAPGISLGDVDKRKRYVSVLYQVRPGAYDLSHHSMVNGNTLERLTLLVALHCTVETS
jgi:hypothetical protein